MVNTHQEKPIYLFPEWQLRTVREWRRKVNQLRKFRANHRCELCGKEGKIDGHHIIQPSNGGSNEDDNIVICCHSCYCDKILIDDKNVDEIYAMMEENQTPFSYKSSYKELAMKVRACGKRRIFHTKESCKNA